jgi:tetratricopeptide (TPR) repeat protein
MIRKPVLRFSSSKKLHRIGLRCLACQKNFTWRAKLLLLDIGTLERKQKGEKPPFGEFVVAAHVVCPHCQAEDRYELSGWQAFIVTLALLWRRWSPPNPQNWLQAVKMGSRDGRVMHPFELRISYEQQVAAQPRKADVRLRYANTLRTLGWMDEAIEQYRQTLALAPQETEALINLAALLAQRDENEAALAHLRTLAAIKPKNKTQREMVLIANEILAGDLRLDELEIGNPLMRRRD